MGERTGIKWTDHTFNGWWGCTKVTAGCKFCYAEAWDKRFNGDHFGKGKPRRRTSAKNWNDPRRWNKKAEAAGQRRRVFCSSMADVFDSEVPESWRADLFQLIRETPWLDWLLLTKRPENIAAMLPPDWGDGWPNVWLGTTVENQQAADERIPVLLKVPAAVRFLSCEPLLGELDIAWALSRKPIEIAVGFHRRGHFAPGMETIRPLDWVIIGGESGADARSLELAWAVDLLRQCVAAGVKVFFKQLGARPLRDGQPYPITDKAGEIMEEFPLALRVREFPEVRRAA